ncbi:nitrite reductase large subunit NirB [Tichowtungia aerotolerans]|uniref:FAD-dependent oxidoreductase n=1 Tax=Tichowtungia aerotolerans TaxID=2697043 RepID=A0A6P1MA90_9BACT|nr:nitrite reductase large subunit NirB [Tichowtungia aerotolerans]QHI69008.1 FAD-dependent oxidoreductase [Tichowtungia aerotolerans]
MIQKEKLVIVGNGMAAGKLVEEILSRSPEQYAITVIGDEPCGNYNRIKLVIKLKEPDLPDFFLNTPEWYADNGVEALLGQAVSVIDRAAKSVTLADGRIVSYDKLVLATGSHPFIPPMTGLDLPGVFALRKLEDVGHIRTFLKDKSHTIVLGGGLLGLELALMLRLIGKQVTVSHLMPSLMELQLPEEAGNYLKRHLEELGVNFVMGTYITDLLGSTAGVEEVRFKDGSSIKTDAVFFNCGIRPNKDLAEQAGLVFNKGIAVNDRLQTSDPFIYACGECIEFKGETWGLVAPVYEQSRTLAAVLCGEQVAYAPSAPVPARLKSDIPVISMGRFKPEPGDEVSHYTDPHGAVYKQLIIQDERIKGAVLVGEDLNADAIELHYSAKIPVPARRADLLFPGARAGDAIMDGSNIPDDAQVCDCNGVCAGKIRKAIANGSDTLYKVMLNTRAGTGCGNCKNKLKALLISEVGELREDPAEKYYAAGVPMDREELTAFIRANSLRSVSQVLHSVPNAVDDSKTRMALDYLLDYIWSSDYVLEEDSRCANDRYSGNIQKDGRFSVIPNMAGGQTTSAHLRAIADVADKYGALIKVTGADRIGLYSVDKTDLKNVWDELQMGSGHAFTKCFRACKACVGSTHCRFGLKDSLELGRVLGERYRGLRSPAKVKMGVSGCPRNCSEATIKDFGVVAVEGGWDIFIGGNGGAQVYVAQKIAQVKTDDEVIRIADRFYEYYCRNAKYGERSAHFIERVGLKTVVDAILHAPEEELCELETRFAQLRENYKDPWENLTDTMGAGMEPIQPETDDGFTQIALVEDMPPGTSQEIVISNHPVAVFHTRDDQWIATDGRCPHEQGPLIDCIIGNGRLTCPIHSYSFDIKTGACDNPDIDPLRIYTIEFRNGRVLVKPQIADIGRGVVK